LATRLLKLEHFLALPPYLDAHMFDFRPDVVEVRQGPPKNNDVGA
jgi:hypothetical protein